MAAVEEAIAGIRAGKPVILPTDTVYGLAATPYRSDPVERIARLKGRELGQPIALVAATAPTAASTAAPSAGHSGTRTPIVSGRSPVSSEERLGLHSGNWQ